MSDESHRVGSGNASREPWGGRFRSDTDATVERFTASIHFDRALARYDLRVSAAHARMLCDRKLISPEDLDALLGGLQQVEEEFESDTLPLDPALEDVHMHVEARLRELVGEPEIGRAHV